MKSVSKPVNKVKRAVELLEIFIDDVSVAGARENANFLRKEAMGVMTASLRFAGDSGSVDEDYIANMGFFFGRINDLCNKLDDYVMDLEEVEHLSK